MKFKKKIKFEILRLTSFLMIPLTILYDGYIDRQNLTEQKNPVENIVPPPTNVDRNNKPNELGAKF